MADLDLLLRSKTLCWLLMAIVFAFVFAVILTPKEYFAAGSRPDVTVTASASSPAPPNY